MAPENSPLIDDFSKSGYEAKFSFSVPDYNFERNSSGGWFENRARRASYWYDGYIYVAKAGRHDFQISNFPMSADWSEVMAWNNGYVQIYINDTFINPHKTYFGDIRKGAYNVGAIELTQGFHRMRVKVRKSAPATGLRFNINMNHPSSFGYPAMETSKIYKAPIDLKICKGGIGEKTEVFYLPDSDKNFGVREKDI